MRRFLLASTLSLVAAGAVPLATAAHAQQVKPTLSKNDPNTGLSSQDWLTMIGNVLNGSALVGIDGVLMVNPLPTPVTVTCDKWTLVGPNPYIKANPSALAPFSVTFVQTKGFDGYCKNGVVGRSGVRTLTARLDGANGSFSESTIITFGDNQ
jgi:hypothetical protein